MAAEPVSMPDVQVEQRALALPDEAQRLVIVDEASYQAACRFLRERCKAVLKEVDETFDPIIKAAHKAHKEATAQKARVSAPILEAERVVKSAVVGYQREQERLSLEAQRAAEAQARRLAETEALGRAAHLESLGRQREAEAVMARPVPAPAVVVSLPAPKAAGVAIAQTWRAEVTDLGALVAAVAADPSRLNLLQPNGPALNQMARALKGALNLPGVRAVSEDSVRARA